MEFVNYSLKVGNNLLIKGLNLSFNQNVVNHLFGSNGSGKSCFAKSCVGMLKNKGQITGNEDIVLLGSSSNVPSDLNIKDIVKLLSKKFGKDKVNELYELLCLAEINQSLPIKKMSDGQKQKIKFLSFLSRDPKVIILDEFTNALDKKSSLDLYGFLRTYLCENNITSINITHNLSDIEYIPGNYYYLHNKSIVQIATKEDVISAYVKGGFDDVGA